MRDRWYDYEPTVPIAVKGGIKLSDGNHAGANWWAGEWLQAMVRSGVGGRLARGKSYAAKGQVVALDIEPGRISARVQGSRNAPYRVSIAAEPVPLNTRLHMLAWLSLQVGLGAQLLVGVLPKSLKSLFADAGYWLFPPDYTVFNVDCSCPDWASPCKHVAAVFMLLAQEFDRDPLLLLKYRGFERSEIIQGLGLTGVTAEPETRETGEESLVKGEPVDSHSFWSGNKVPSLDVEEVTSHDVHGPLSLLRQVGHFPMWRGEKPLIACLYPLYKQAVDRATE